ncbi:MAG: GNAT family N-acetyltransferase [Deltaproteobacteria bacterium]|nr:GNAT family N-acetyltransferase [Deltaproteobacteria bacterium]
MFTFRDFNKITGFRPYQKGDEKDLNVILRKIYHREVNDAYWWWKYLENPLGSHFSYCALLDDRVVGFAGGIPYRIKAGDREIIGGQLMDLMVEPELQGKKAFSPIMKASLGDLMKKTDMYYGFTNEHSFRVYSQDKRHEVAFKVPRMIKILNTEALIKNKVSLDIAAKAVGSLSDFGLKITEKLQSSSKKSDLNIQMIDKFDERFDEFWEKVSAHFEILQVRDHNYLEWRYSRHPLIQYTTYAVEEKNDILGFMVLKNESDEINRGFFLEFFALPERQDVQDLLLNKAQEHFINRDVDVITAWMFPHAPYYKTFRRHMFFSRPGDLIVMVNLFKGDNDAREFIKNPLNWYVSCGDHESF